jgi:SIT family siderophore-iron:H+ symporter-like MFS transporter
MGVLQGVIGAAGQPVAAKISDVVGRVEMLIAAIVIYVIGTIIEASSKGIASYCVGVVLFQIGYTMYTIMIQVIVTDLSSLQSRLFASFIPPSPWLINTWISGNIAVHFTADQGERGLWRWGLGMLTIITPGKYFHSIEYWFVADYQSLLS